APRNDSHPFRKVDLQGLKSSRAGLDDLDSILVDAMATANYEVPRQMWKAAKLVFATLPADLAVLCRDFDFDPQPNVLRAQIKALRANLETKIHIAEREGIPEVPKEGPSDRAPATEPTWAQLDRLREAAHIDVEDLA